MCLHTHMHIIVYIIIYIYSVRVCFVCIHDSINDSWRITGICQKAAGRAALVVFPEGRPQVPGHEGCPNLATPSPHFGWNCECHHRWLMAALPPELQSTKWKKAWGSSRKSSAPDQPGRCGLRWIWWIRTTDLAFEDKLCKILGIKKGP